MQKAEDGALDITGCASRILLTAGNQTVDHIRHKKTDPLAIVRRRRRGSIALVAFAFLFLPALSMGQSGSKPAKEKDNETTKLRIEVTAGEAGDPVEGASIYIRYKEERKFAKDKKIEQNWKTNKEGVVKVPGVPRGEVLVQVIAQGWKTFGKWYDLDQDEQTIKIRLQKPPRWY
jgi:hypothetical protein